MVCGYLCIMASWCYVDGRWKGSVTQVEKHSAFDELRRAAMANIIVVERLRLQLIAAVGPADQVEVPVVILKPQGKCEKCSFYQAKLAGVESLL